MAETIPGGKTISADGYWQNANGQWIDEDGHLVDEPVKANVPKKASAIATPATTEKK
jgi:hypothetical protein